MPNSTALLSPFYNGPFILRLCDDAVFESSYADDYSESAALADLFIGNSDWYFRQITRLPRRWWQIRRRWKRTGAVWQPISANQFRVITTEEANYFCK